MKEEFIELQFKVDQDLYEEMQNVLVSLGITVEKATELFLETVVRLGKIPFEYSEGDIQAAKECCKVSESRVFEDIKTGIEQAIEYERVRKNPMQKRFFTSDLHFGHENVLRFDDRKFKDVDEMDAELIRRWNAKVGKGDIVYVLGDMIWKTRNGVAEDLIKSLNGQIILIKGNHDRFLHNAGAKNALAGVKDYEDISVTLEDGTVRRCILSHYFMPFYIGHRHNAIHLHGHSHNTEEHLYELEITELLRQKGYTPRIVNVGCMHWNYEPVTLDEILTKYPM